MQAFLQHSILRIRARLASRIAQGPGTVVKRNDVQLLLNGATDHEFVAVLKAWEPAISPAELSAWLTAFHRANGRPGSKPPAR